MSNEDQQAEPTEAPKAVIEVEELQPNTVNVDKAATPRVIAAEPEAAPFRRTAQSDTVQVVTDTKVALTTDNYSLMIKKLKESGTQHQKAVIDFFDQYLVAMDPKLPAPKDAELYKQQQGLWTTLKSVLDDAPDEEFTKTWSLILAIFNRHNNGKSAVSDVPIHRGSWLWSDADKRLTALQNLINLIQLTRKPEERQLGLKQVDMERALKDGLSDQARRRILAFYGK